MAITPPRLLPQLSPKTFDAATNLCIFMQTPVHRMFVLPPLGRHARDDRRIVGAATRDQTLAGVSFVVRVPPCKGFAEVLQRG